MIVLWQGGSNFWVSGRNPKWGHSNEIYWAVLSCGAVYYAVQGGLTSDSVDEILNCVHSTEIYWAVLSFGAVYYGVQDGSNL